ncbi:tripartite-type tricarboxylate transporter receptor subunit TctC [Variovorax sp. TBS-050B]|uniref:Bug family tripartite tricarboxylate transporter substrate binding protein n=1 Tax=Variovorax sp. TBS-050B TaxID=2940551 RepID=UPI0024758C2B|nr:tripartite tricarboxylate transporter substrate binding protein [Variovorax sp. TBS-050B]MDH6594910.1 tripartite-type tricarboxylate transporter receptor subunit TctC [Variovorax sp. TBS-050B]
MKKRIATFLLGFAWALAAAAQAWPARPVHLVVPAPPGSSLDLIARTLAERLRPMWKQPVVVETRPGAGGLIGMDAVAKAPADGHTLGIGFNGPIAFGPAMYSRMPYAPARDLLPIVLTTSQPNVLAVQAGNPANTLPEFVAWAKKQGRGLSYASVGAGSSSHLTMELFRSLAGIEAVHVPYAGSPPAGLSVAAGDTQALFTVAPALLPLVQGQRIKLLAVTSAQRSERMKALPTVAESGYPGFEALAWNGLFTASGTPPEVVRRINADVNTVLREPAVRELLAQQGLAAGGGSPEAFGAFIDEEARKWGAIITRVGIRIDQ